MIVLGIGAGGCGLASLAYLLGAQERSEVTKEAYSMNITWEQGLSGELAALSKWKREQRNGAGPSGDVAWYHLPYIWELAKHENDLKVVYLHREPEKQAAHLVQGFGGTNPFCESPGFPRCSSAAWYPRLGIPDPLDAARVYVDLYHQLALKLYGLLPTKIGRFSTKYLDSARGQEDILKFCGIQNPVVFKEGIHV